MLLYRQINVVNTTLLESASKDGLATIAQLNGISYRRLTQYLELYLVCKKIQISNCSLKGCSTFSRGNKWDILLERI